MSSIFGGRGEPQDLKLNEREQKQVAKLLSDPTYFPLEFRTWLKNYIQDAGLIVTASQIRGQAGTRTGLPAGLMLPLGGMGALPPDTLLCDGVAYSRVTYKALFDAIGTAWGAGDGSTTFNTPDLRDRALFGAGQAIGVGATDGHPFGSRSGWRHRHTVNDPGHVHSINNPDAIGADKWSHQWLRADNLDQADPNTDIRSALTGISVGPAGTSLDGPDWAGVLVAITTGKSA